MSCELTPISAFLSTNLNNKIDSFQRLADRIVRVLGAPVVSIEIHQDQLFEAISISCEMFAKYAGYTREYLVFNSELYEKGKGIRLDNLYTLSFENLQGDTTAVSSSAMYDYDIMNYRKVIDVTNFEEGSNSGINTLFTIEQTLAQQTYFSYAMGNYGFDLVSWYTLKEWLELREKLLSIRRSIEFNERTQYMKIYPEPRATETFYGVVACYVEKPLRDIIKEAWVFQHALARVKTIVGNIRGKIPVSMFGGQLFNAEFAAQGAQELEKLEQQLFTNAAGFGDSDPCIFLVG